MDEVTKAKYDLNSPEGSIAPSTLRTISAFTGFATETYLGNRVCIYGTEEEILTSPTSFRVLVYAHIFNPFNLVLPLMVYGNFWI